MELSKSLSFSNFSQNFYFKTFKYKPLSNPISKKYFPFHPPFSTSSRFKLYAHFGHPSKRQNYLRKKLTHQHQQVSKESIIYNPNLNNVSDLKSSSVGDNSDFVDYGTESASSVNELESKKGLIGDSVLWNKLESWVEQYKKDIEFWGIGNGTIFTVFRDSEGKVERVEVNEDEILRRSGVDASVLYKGGESEDVVDVNSKISYAKELARELERGDTVLPKNSSVSKFVVSGETSGFVDGVTRGAKLGFENVIQGVTRTPRSFPRVSSFGVPVLVGLIVVWAVRKLFTVGTERRQYTNLEKEMLRRKSKAREKREKVVKGSVEIIQESVEPECVSIERPVIDKDELMKNIIKAKGSNEASAIERLGNNKAKNEEFSNKIQEIRAMARHAREVEKRDASSGNSGEEYIQSDNVLSNQKKVMRKLGNGYIDSKVNSPIGDTGHSSDDNVATTLASSDDLIKSNETWSIKASDGNGHTQSVKKDVVDSSQNVLTSEASKLDQQLHSRAPNSSRKPFKKRVRIIKSVDEAREYLSRKREKQDVDLEPEAREEDDTFMTEPSGTKTADKTVQKINKIEKVIDASTSNATLDLTDTSESITDKEKDCILNNSNAESVDVRGDIMSEIEKSTSFLTDEGNHCSEKNGMPLSTLPGDNAPDGYLSQRKNMDKEFSPSISVRNSNSIAREDLKLEKDSSLAEKVLYSENFEEGKEVIDSPATAVGDGKTGGSAELKPLRRADNWLEKNFHELEPIIKKMGVSFRDNYMTAKAKTNQDLNSKPMMIPPNSNDGDSELAWMKDEKLSDIVFKVRDNELAGRDPFHSMNEGDKLAFFSGLEKKVEQESKKLLNLHEWLHANIENLDYGEDGISLYDPPEKVIPRWKGPPLGEIDFLNNSMEQKLEDLADNVVLKPVSQDSLNKESASCDIIPSSSRAPDLSSKLQNEIPKSSKTIIQGSDGSIRAGKKAGKEFWQHTKKWSQGFLDCYNAETDPEIKGVMKDMGKDLDRWITEKEIKEAAELMDRLPETGKKFIKEKLDKVRREVELFGPQAVVSKYREYGDEEEEDYLWWLDLPYVLCIELYTEQEGESKVGLYSLEMAPDLELSPKPCHVIGFEDASACKSLCYIIQHHMEMLGNGNAFVIARPPKDTFREAKANGFGVTVIRKGELQLNVDQTLEEVEELITEIGSKVYHDKIMRERSADISALMKGVFGLKKPSRRRRRSKRKLKKPTGT